MTDMFLAKDDADVYLLLLFCATIVLLYETIWRAYLRTEHLRVAIKASNDFYDRAERLLLDPDTPTIVRQMISDIGLAVTDERAGEKAVGLILRCLADIAHRGYPIKPTPEFLSTLDGLRYRRGDLYDAFHEALGAGFLAIVLLHGSSATRSKMALSYEAGSSDRSKMLSMAQKVDAGLVELRTAA